MATALNFTQIPQPVIVNQIRSSSHQTPPISSDNGLEIVAITVFGISAAAFLLASYYIFATKCFPRIQGRFEHEQLTPHSASPLSRGVHKRLIQEIPIFEYIRSELECSSSSLLKCVVCLNEFQENDMLRMLPKCNHAFHLECIDVWLQSNSNCPLCRSTIHGSNRLRSQTSVAPDSSSQHLGNIVRDDCVVIEVSGEVGTDQGRSYSRRNLMQHRSLSSRMLEQKTGGHRGRQPSAMGVRRKDQQFSGVPIRRSLSMDSAVNARVFRLVRGRGSRNAVIPMEF